MALFGTVFGVAMPSVGQVATPDLTTTPIRVTSGVVSNEGDHSAVLFQHVVTVVDTSSVQLQFGRTKLPAGTVLRTTSLTDGAVQHHTEPTLGQWNFCSAWFNGPMVLVELVAEPGAGPAHVSIEQVRAMTGTTTLRSICFETDDRVLSDDDRSGRVAPIGCSGWLIDDPAHSFLSAGHCLDSLDFVDTMEFNVPLSNADGSWNHPGPEDQYPIDDSSVQFTDGGYGNDWGYYGCFANTETGLTAFEVQGISHTLADAAPAADGRDITITGYGSVAPPVSNTWNSVQKTHTGPYMDLDGTTVGYQTDTSSGNSGSPVLDEVTGLAIGIHTHAGCDSTGGWNRGTDIVHPDLQWAMDHPLGVCIPSTVAFAFPDGRPLAVPPGVATDLLFSASPIDKTPDPDSVSVRITIDGVVSILSASPLPDDQYLATIPPLMCGQNVSFYLHATTESGGTVTHPWDAPDSQFILLVGTLEGVILLNEDFSGGIPADWTATGLWHASSGACAPGGDCAEGDMVYFGQEGSCDYDTGDTEFGLLSTPPLSPDGDEITLRFCAALNAEDYTGYDEARVYANGVEVAHLEQAAGWTDYEIDISGIAGDTLTIAFEFDTVDDLYNEYTGWHLDTIKVIGTTTDCTDPVDCPADIDGSGSVGTDDLLALIADWGLTNSPADIDGNGTVGTDDLLLLIAAWGPCE
jgi:V8-like Glu-specific endopeptidase